MMIYTSTCRVDLKDLLGSIKEDHPSKEVRKALENLKKVVKSAQQIKKFSSYKSEIDKLNQRLTNASERLNGALHVYEEERMAKQQQRLDEQDKTLQKMKSDSESKCICIVQ